MNSFYNILFSFIVSLIVFFGLGWIVVNIFYAIFPYNINDGLRSLYVTTQIIYCTVSVFWGIIVQFMTDDESDWVENITYGIYGICFLCVM
jgi:hypothetical protein